MLKKTTYSAPGKIIIAGEHAVVYGYPSIVSAIDMRTMIHFTPLATNNYRLELKDLDISIRTTGLDQFLERTSRDFPIINRVLNLIDEKQEDATSMLLDRGFHVEISSSIPIGAGLGSSATVCAGLGRMFLDQLGVQLTETEFLEFSKNAEKIYHSNSSGVDTTAATRGGAFLFKEGNIIDKIASKLVFNGDLLIVNTGVPRNTGKMVSGLRALYEKDRENVTKRFDHIEKLVDATWKLFKSGEIAVESLGRLFLENHEELAALGLSIDAIDNIIDISMKNGAEGGKLTGAGGGGSVLITCLKDNTRSIIKALENKGFETRLFLLDMEGLKKK